MQPLSAAVRGSLVPETESVSLAVLLRHGARWLCSKGKQAREGVCGQAETIWAGFAAVLLQDDGCGSRVAAD
jgi:hypothetical protein